MAAPDEDLMRHLIVSRELPPASYPAGGIGTYVANMSRLLAEAGDTVHVIGERWRGAPDERVVDVQGRLVTHRIPAAKPVTLPRRASTMQEISLLRDTAFPMQAWSWNVALLVEELVESEQIDVIEAQEWEAPLYYFLLRRALGLGPARQPPVIIQLHSPSEFCWRHNKWPVARPEYLLMRRQEEYCIAAADALLCPSRYLAAQAEERYRLPGDSVTVIPLPIGHFPALPHAELYTGPVACVGRLEPRKGSIEFVEAVVRVAPEFPHVEFEFIGADMPYQDGLTVRRYLAGLIPRSLQQRLRFHRSVPRTTLAEILARASLAVVPSRWENFPNTCIEAMVAGLPVLASPNGGMVEMVQDGVTGWIAATQRPDDLAAALRRALSTTPLDRAAMGRAAAASIREMCDSASVVEAQRRFRDQVANAGVRTSHRIATTRHSSGNGVHRVARPHTNAVAIVSLDASPGLADALLGGLNDESPVGVAVRARETLVDEDGLALANAVLRRDAEVGLISGWITGAPASCSTAPAAFPYQWLTNDVHGVVVFRRQALEGIADLERLASGDDALWELSTAVLANGWKSVALPAVLGRAPKERGRRGANDDSSITVPHEKLRYFHDTYPQLFQGDLELQNLLLDIGVTAAEQIQRTMRDRLTIDRWRNLTPHELWRLPTRHKLELLNAAMRDPQRTMSWLRNNGAFLFRKPHPQGSAVRAANSPSPPHPL